VRKGIVVGFARPNTGAINFFRRMGYGKPKAEVWVGKVLQHRRKSSDIKK
jgi:hypothetical protein